MEIFPKNIVLFFFIEATGKKLGGCIMLAKTISAIARIG